jgi:large subunit ribosomal protein L4
MLSLPVYNTNGEKIGEESIDPSLLGSEVNKQLLHDVVLMYQANRRVGTVNTRGRSDVAGSGKKLFRQKGTGNARVGAKRTNKRVGGGVAFARRNRDYSYTMPKKAVRLATRMALLSKIIDKQVVIIDGLSVDKPQTKTVYTALAHLQRPDIDHVTCETKSQDAKQKLSTATLLLGLAEHDPNLYKSARNIDGVIVSPVAEFNTLDILKQRYLVLTREAFGKLKTIVENPIVRRNSITTVEV